MTLYCKLNRDARCPFRFPFSFSSWKPLNSFNFSGPCRNMISFQSSYFLTTSTGSLRQSFAISRRSFICHIIKYNNLSKLITQDNFSAPEIEKVFGSLVAKHNIKLGNLAQPVRVASAGKAESPGIFEVLEILGKEKVLERLEKAIETIG